MEGQFFKRHEGLGLRVQGGLRFRIYGIGFRGLKSKANHFQDPQVPFLKRGQYMGPLPASLIPKS